MRRLPSASNADVAKDCACWLYLASRLAADEPRPHDSETSARLVFPVFAAHLSGTWPEQFLPATVEIVLRGLLAG